MYERGAREVAPYTGAWIEISANSKNGRKKEVAPYTGAWIEITVLDFESLSVNVAPYTGAWIEIAFSSIFISSSDSRSLHGSVNWNDFYFAVSFTAYNVAPYTGAWIEIGNFYWSIRIREKVAPYTGVILKIRKKVESW